MTKQARRYTEVNRLIKKHNLDTQRAIHLVAEKEQVGWATIQSAYYRERKRITEAKPPKASVAVAVAAPEKTPEKTPEELIGDAVDALAAAIGLIRVRLVDIEKREADIKAFDDKIAALLNAAATTN